MYDIEKITNPSFIKNLSTKEMQVLCQDIRTFLIDSLSKTGGHVSSNLGVVELTVAMHKVFNSPEDKFIWDVGHQVYIHKMLTGRANQFSTLRQYKGLSGFPKRKESEHDCWETGHASTSISAAVGMAYARDLNDENYHVVAVIGDGSLTGGMAYEALNHIGHTNKRLIVIINDNEMAISPNVGALHNIFGSIRTNESYLNTKRRLKKLLKNTQLLNRVMYRAKGSLKRFVIGETPFDAMGFKYFGPVDGHNLDDLIKNLNFAKKADKPVIVHVKTKKGKGYSFAEADKLGTWHGVGKFNKETGEVSVHKKENCVSWSKLMCNGLIELTKHDSRVSVITPAMINGSALNDYQMLYPDRLIDVGIAEEHAVTFAAGLAAEGMIPVVAVYSSFLQRAYDQILHDVCMQNLHVIFAIDRSGLVGADGETHQGIFDTAFLSHIPNLVIMAPKNRYELTRAMEWAVAYDGPIAIKYARGQAYYGLKDYNEPVEYGKSEILREGSEIALVAVGNMVEETEKLYNRFLQEGRQVTFVNARFIKPLDKEMIDHLAETHKLIVTIEEGILHGGYGALVEEYLESKASDVKVLPIAIEDTFVRHGSVEELRKMLKIDAESIYRRIRDIME